MCIFRRARTGRASECSRAGSSHTVEGFSSQPRGVDAPLGSSGGPPAIVSSTQRRRKGPLVLKPHHGSHPLSAHQRLTLFIITDPIAGEA